MKKFYSCRYDKTFKEEIFKHTKIDVNKIKNIS